MVTQMSADAPVFAAIADPTRRAILDAIRNTERSAGEIASLFTVSRPAISKHLRVLRTAGLVRERRDARSRLYSLNATPLRQVDQWLEHYRLFWTVRLGALKQVAESQGNPSTNSRRSR